MSRAISATLVAALFLAGCASGVRALTPYTSEETERDRAACLGAGGLWIENAARYTCTGAQPPAPPADDKVRT